MVCLIRKLKLLQQMLVQVKQTIGDTLTFCSHPNLNVGDMKYDFKTLKQEYDYLLNLPDIEISMKDVEVILGQDAYHLIRPLEYKSAEKSQP